MRDLPRCSQESGISDGYGGTTVSFVIWQCQMGRFRVRNGWLGTLLGGCSRYGSVPLC